MWKKTFFLKFIKNPKRHMFQLIQALNTPWSIQSFFSETKKKDRESTAALRRQQAAHQVPKQTHQILLRQLHDLVLERRLGQTLRTQTLHQNLLLPLVLLPQLRHLPPHARPLRLTLPPHLIILILKNTIENLLRIVADLELIAVHRHATEIRPVYPTHPIAILTIRIANCTIKQSKVVKWFFFCKNCLTLYFTMWLVSHMGLNWS